jgi:hypothetical protein
MFYTNAYCEDRFGGCPGPSLGGSSVAAQYGEKAQHPGSKEFYDNFARQISWVKQSQGKVIEIDNMDFYVEKGHTAAIVKLIQFAAQNGINVMSKNETNAQILSQPNVVGVVVEQGSGDAAKYRSAFTAAGKPNAGVLIINGACTPDQYTSCTKSNHPKYQQGGCTGSEYTKFCGCGKNEAGLQIAGTPVANGTGENFGPSPGSALPPGSVQAPGAFANNSPPGEWGGGSTAAPASSGASQASAAPAQSPSPRAALGPADFANPYKPGDPFSATSQNKPSSSSPQNSSHSDASDDELDELLGESDVASEENGGGEKSKKLLSAQRATVRCLPASVVRGQKATLAWRCPSGFTSSISSMPTLQVNTKGKRFGTTQISLARTTTFTLACENEKEVTRPVSCTVSQSTVKPSIIKSTRAFEAPAEVQSSEPKMCFMGFCL